MSFAKAGNFGRGVLIQLELDAAFDSFTKRSYETTGETRRLELPGTSRATRKPWFTNLVEGRSVERRFGAVFSQVACHRIVPLGKFLMNTRLSQSEWKVRRRNDSANLRASLSPIPGRAATCSWAALWESGQC
jgi:hypothetical protein